MLEAVCDEEALGAVVGMQVAPCLVEHQLDGGKGWRLNQRSSCSLHVL